MSSCVHRLVTLQVVSVCTVYTVVNSNVHCVHYGKLYTVLPTPHSCAQYTTLHYPTLPYTTQSLSWQTCSVCSLPLTDWHGVAPHTACLVQCSVYLHVFCVRFILSFSLCSVLWVLCIMYYVLCAVCFVLCIVYCLPVSETVAFKLWFCHLADRNCGLYCTVKLHFT